MEFGERYGFATGKCRWPKDGCYDQRNKVVLAPGGVDIIVHHRGYVGFPEQPNSTGVELLEHRENHLVEYLLEALQARKGRRVKQCLTSSFVRLDKDLEEIVKANECSPISLHAEALWRTRYNSLVILVDRKNCHVHVAGNGLVHAVLANADGSGIKLTRKNKNALAELLRQQHYRSLKHMSPRIVCNTHLWADSDDGTLHLIPMPFVSRLTKRKTLLYHYKRVPLNPEHEHVIVASESFVDRDLWFRAIWRPVEFPIAKLPGYFDSMGFEEVIRQVVFEGRESGPVKMLLVLCLNHTRHSVPKRIADEPVDDTGMSHSSKLPKKACCSSDAP